MSLDDFFLSPNNVIGRISPVPGPAEQIPFAALTPALLTQLALSTGAANVGFLPSGIGAVPRPVGTKLLESVSALDFNAKGDNGTTDDSAAITAALASANEVLLPRTSTVDVNTGQCIYRVDSEIQVTDNKRLMLARGVILKRFTANSAATTPVVSVLGIGGELTGGTIQSENASPSGIVRLGNTSSTDNRNAWWWRFTNSTVLGRTAVGAGDIGVNVPSGQVTNPAKANYFGCIQNINIQNADIGLLLDEMANAHTGGNIQFWNCRTANFRIRGAYANCFTNVFFHQSFASGCIGVDIRNKVSGTQDPVMNNIIGFVDETTGAADVPYFLDTAAANNVLIGSNNTVTGGTNNATGSNTILVGAFSPVFAFANNITVGNGVARGTVTAKGGTIGLSLSSAGGGTVQILTNNSNALQVEVLHTSAATSNITLTGSTTNIPTIGVAGAGTALNLGGGADLQWGKALVAMGAGGAPTLGTTGGTGPATTTQNTWLRFLDSTGAAAWVPVWK
jgi:hypothetical protein